jgi:hypothetical protein
LISFVCVHYSVYTVWDGGDVAFSGRGWGGGGCIRLWKLWRNPTKGLEYDALMDTSKGEEVVTYIADGLADRSRHGEYVYGIPIDVKKSVVVASIGQRVLLSATRQKLNCFKQFVTPAPAD